MKTRSYLSLVVAIILVPALAVAGWGLVLLLGKEREARFNVAEARASAIALDIDQEVAAAEGKLRVLANTSYIEKGDFVSLYQLMQKVNRTPDSWTVLYDENGQTLINTKSPFGADFTGLVYDWVPSAIALKQVTTSNLRMGLVSKSPVVSVNMPVVTASGKKYLLGQVFPSQYFAEMLSTHNIPDSWIVGVVGSDGITITRNRNANTLTGQAVVAEIRNAMSERPSGRVKNISRDNIPLFTVFTHTERTQWVVAIGVPQVDIEAPARNALRYSLFSICLIFGVAAFVVFALANRLTQAFNNAVRAGKRLSNGEIPTFAKQTVKEADVLLGVLHDAGTTLAAERHRRQSLEQERESLLQNEKEARRLAEDQNAAKDDFLAMLGHELRNPLAPISAAAQLLKIAKHDETTVQRTSDIIERQVDHLTELIEDLLDVSRVTRGLAELEKENVDIKSVLSDAVEQVRPLIESRSHALNIHIDATHACAQGDRTRLIQVITNLLNNAAKYTPQGGVIELSVGVERQWIKIKVIDNGMGIEPSLLPHIFELFRQGKRTPDRAQGGLGLGLALVKSIVALHGGTIEAYSDGLGKGCTFELRLPVLALAQTSGVGSDHQKHEDSLAVALDIMIVDDNLDAAHSLALLLESKGHRIRVEANAQNALASAAIANATIYILDIGLPDLDGYELARRLRAGSENTNALMIALTGYGQAHDKVLSKAAGFDHHFVKPVAIEQLDRIFAAFTKGTSALS
ncbi:ATP-binding protein [Herbaspirillum sp. GCM10030257]|uniref:hybrid sensor histidine kinase/response regulator n=1 Tax=Herbaspirillum sp. GCM10030257 TaxID=3273393 RepID=UPI00361C5BA9